MIFKYSSLLHDIPPSRFAVIHRLLVTAALAAFAPQATADIIIFSDDLENGSSNWIAYPGSTPLQYVSTSTDPYANHTSTGSYGLKLSDPNNRVYHDVNLSTHPESSVRFSLWYYDVMDRRPLSFSTFDIRNANSSQVLGLGAYFSSDYYGARLLKTADGTAAPNWVATTVARSVGWQHFEIVQYRGEQAGTVEYYVNGILGYRTTNAHDDALSRMVLGLGWAENIHQEGYVDDISYEVVVPEPTSGMMAAMALAAALTPRRWRARLHALR